MLDDHPPEKNFSNYNQDQDQDQGPYVLAHPGDTPGDNSEPNTLELLIDEWKAGELEPSEVKLGRYPSRLGPVQRAIAEHMRLLMGLRMAAGDDRPLPYAATMPVTAGIVSDKAQASRAIRALVATGVVRYVGSLPPRGLPNGTKLYAPPEQVADVVDFPGERRAA